jgi:peptidoglycan/LPS O-acetylase OafA/YrhL
MDVSAQLKWISALVGLIGLWLIVRPHPFSSEAPFSDFWSDLIVGFVLLSLAIYTYARWRSASSQWAMAVAVFGGWVILGAFLGGEHDPLLERPPRRRDRGRARRLQRVRSPRDRRIERGLGQRRFGQWRWVR